MRTNPIPAFAARDFGWRLVKIRIFKWSTAASVAAAFKKFSVHMDDISRARLLVKVVHVLGTDEKAILQRVFKFGESEVCWIWFGCRSNAPTHGIELPYQPGIAVPRYGRSDLLDPIIPPQSTRAPECWNAAFRAHACPGKYEDAFSGGNSEHL